MKRKLQLSILFVVLALLLGNAAVLAQGPTGGKKAPRANAGTAFTYQGQLKNNGTAVNATCDFQFGLWDDSAVGAQVGATQTIASAVTNGLFTVQLNASGQITTGTAFNGDARWLASSVRCPSGGGSYTALNPRQTLNPAPMAFALPGLYTQQNATSPNIIGGYSGNSVTAGVHGATIGGGGSFSINKVTDDFGTVAGGYANQAGDGDGVTTNNIAATVGGGRYNTASGNSTVGGGESNTASNYWSTIGGGESNTASGQQATVSGGWSNTASNSATTVGGGMGNTASGNFATVPGGASNSATMSYTLAAGRQAKANHPGAFVWADSNNNGVSGADFASTATDQFLIRAGGGVGIGTNSPAAQLHVSSGGVPQVRIDQTNSSDYARLRMAVGSANFWDIAVGTSTTDAMNFYKLGTGNVMSLSGGATHITMIDGATEAGGNWVNFSDRNAKENFASLDSRSVLARVASLPIQSWNYKTEDASVRHIGPMAQDFYAAFNVGADNKHIGTVDEGGVALAAIQGLNQVVQEKDAEISNLKSQVADLKQQNTTIEARLTALEQLAQTNNLGAHTDNPWNVAMLVGGALLGIVIVRRPWQGGTR